MAAVEKRTRFCHVKGEHIIFANAAKMSTFEDDGCYAFLSYKNSGELKKMLRGPFMVPKKVKSFIYGNTESAKFRKK